MSNSTPGPVSPTIHYRDEDNGTIITLVTDDGNEVRVELMEGRMAAGLGGGRRVTVLRAPVSFDRSAMAHIFSAPPSAIDRSLLDAMLGALPTISQGDVIVILFGITGISEGAADEDQTPLIFFVQDMSIERS